jgi:hypothetical protein
MASGGSVAVQDHIRRRGVFNTMQLSGLQDNAILQKELAGSNAKAPYYPWRYSPDSDMGSDITRQHKDVADYIGARVQAQIQLRNNANRSGMTTANTDIRPTLIAEQEMARRGWLVNPTLAQIYSTESVSQEQHDVDSIAYQTGRGPPVRKHRLRTDYGAPGMVVDDI